MPDPTKRLLLVTLAAVLSLSLAAPAAAKPKLFINSDDAKEDGEPQQFLPDYDKLVGGKEADWVYLPQGSLKTYKSVFVKDFVSNADEDHEIEAKNASAYGKNFLRKWLKKEGFNVVDEGGELTIEGNVFNAWEPSGAARFWGGWMANPGCGQELIARDAEGKIVGQIRHKSRGSTIKDAVENGLEEMAKSMALGK